jgi:sugar phosphate isomerase/epimerase
VPDVATAMQIVDGAGRANGGLVVDIWHHLRSGRDDAALRAVPAEKVFTVQLSDGPAQAPDDIVAEAVYGRRLPGEGDFDVVGFLRLLGEIGVRASVGPELYHASFEQRDPVEVAKELAAATRRVLGRAGQVDPADGPG